jgi:hypothetical protein
MHALGNVDDAEVVENARQAVGHSGSSPAN